MRCSPPGLDKALLFAEDIDKEPEAFPERILEKLRLARESDEYGNDYSEEDWVICKRGVVGIRSGTPPEVVVEWRDYLDYLKNRFVVDADGKIISVTM
ncbi:MAG: hypothetical protein LBT41_02820 [Candidatus Methanoplasma sp.]|jgi:hypothetical protein|nr:hypothetical protein [Candidatus Methanoplasma sp.]